ncbi:ABC transporter ATP-binding protein [Halovulum dunhuangense]|uniref:ABC transporter ATP-binding protein n=1 Tax=Halovulum dunhuangense TaxID=1505036 RepID=A0A849KWX6_9RHOB|nr:dipeptide ABC transporter ATP-binding protein [Halovulum dunhuangense]NNU78857.1 ABC transporter ATP-binding protein [Halovulum dunhuangense]
MSLLEIADLGLSIAGQPVLERVSLGVRPGRILGLIGESGSGKSMTALSVMRLLPRGARLSGRIAFEGQDLAHLSEARMGGIRGAGIGMVFQEPMTALNPLQTIGAQVAETLRLHDRLSRAEAARRARAVLDRVGLPEPEFPLSRYPHELSGGQRQRVVIAMAIARRPKLLIADEPTTALDVTTQAQILVLIRRLVDEDGMGAILITHDLAVVSGLAEEVAIMRAGSVVEAGPTAEVFARRAHPYTRALFAASTHQPERPRRDPGAALLEVENVTRRYEGRRGLFGASTVKTAVDAVSFTLRKGESLGLVGESGCGKSTLTRAILGLEPLQGGRIRLGGEAIDAAAGVPGPLRARMQVVFQDPYGSFNPRHRVARLLAEPFHLLPDAPQGQAREAAVTEALEAVGLQASDAGKYIHEFSGGQRQRIAIARALVIRPALIVLDEAVSALDVRVRAQILDLLADLTRRFDLSYLFISHDLHVVRRITDRVLVMQSGRIVEEGATEAVFTAPRHAYTRTLLAATPRLPDTGA